MPFRPVTDAAGACPSTPNPEEAGRTPSSWYALRLRSNREHAVADNLARIGMEVFLPTWSETVQWSDRRKVVTRVLFPGYVFARLCGPLGYFAALCTRGVVQILPNSHNPLAITDQEIENVRRVVASGLTMACCDYSAGDLITIDTGPLAGVSGVVKATKGALRVVVGIEMLRRAVSVTLDAGTLVKRTEATS